MKKIIYQPNPNKDIEEIFIVARNCEDRFNLIFNFLEKNNVNLENKKIIDIGSNSGYFVNRFYEYSKESHGIEINKKLVLDCKILYPRIKNNIHLGDFLNILDDLGPSNITLFLSLIHRYILNKKDYVQIIKTIDKNTEDFLFFEMGQDHESWYKNSLSGWDKEKIKSFILENTTFDFCEYLGTDRDSFGEFEGNLGRDLFVCYRTK